MHSTDLGLLYVSEKRKKDIVPTICLAAIFLKQGRKVRGKPHFPQKNWSKHIFQRCLKSLLMLQMLRKTDLCKQPSLLPSGHRPGQESINSHVVCSYNWNWDAQNPLHFHFLKRLNVDEWFFPLWFSYPVVLPALLEPISYVRQLACWSRTDCYPILFSFLFPVTRTSWVIYKRYRFLVSGMKSMLVK